VWPWIIVANYVLSYRFTKSNSCYEQNLNFWRVFELYLVQNTAVHYMCVTLICHVHIPFSCFLTFFVIIFLDLDKKDSLNLFISSSVYMVSYNARQSISITIQHWTHCSALVSYRKKIFQDVSLINIRWFSWGASSIYIQNIHKKIRRDKEKLYTGCLKKNATEIQQTVVHHKLN
jgi:hypothetical protein